MCDVDGPDVEWGREGLQELAEPGDEAFWAEAYSFAKDGVEYIGFHMVMLGGDAFWKDDTVSPGPRRPCHCGHHQAPQLTHPHRVARFSTTLGMVFV